MCFVNEKNRLCEKHELGLAEMNHLKAINFELSHIILIILVIRFVNK